MKRSGTNVDSTALLAAGLLAWMHPEAAARAFRAAAHPVTTQTARPCALPGCEATTTHNGGYCCADHCREHRQRQRTANGKDEAQNEA